MKASELRYGNLFYPIDRSSKVHLPMNIAFSVLEIRLFKVMSHKADENPVTVEPVFWGLEDVSPIPLTEEWLLKFDFEIRYFNNDPEKPLWWKVEKNRHIDIYPHHEHKFYFLINSMQMSTPIKYVHQLQNLYFALTAEELTLKTE